MDLACLELALGELDYRILHEAKIRGWQQQQRPAKIVAQFPDLLCQYDIGFVHNTSTQAYDMVADWWAIRDRIGQDQDQISQQIMQRYAYHKVLKTVQEQGFTLAEERAVFGYNNKQSNLLVFEKCFT